MRYRFPSSALVSIKLALTQTLRDHEHVLVHRVVCLFIHQLVVGIHHAYQQRDGQAE